MQYLGKYGIGVELENAISDVILACCQRNSSIFMKHFSTNIFSKAIGDHGIIYSQVTVEKAFDNKEKKEIVRYNSK